MSKQETLVDGPVVKTYLAVFAGMGLAIALATDSSLDQERRNPGPASIDFGSRLAASILFVTIVAIAALDMGRFHWTHIITRPAQIAAFIVLTFAAGFEVAAMAANPFFSTAIRIQTERSHRVVNGGPYRFIRHPGYLAMAVSMPVTAIAFGSGFALIPAICYSTLILWRTWREDQFLTDELEGYAGYANHVRHRLIPGIW